MTLIRVEPESIRRYGHTAQATFDDMHGSLVGLVHQVVAVRYFGPNAFTFKSEVGRLAAEFANRLHLDMQAMAEAVRISTTNIAAALGGSPISIRLDPRPITPPSPAVVDFVDVDTAALEALNPVVVDRFEALRRGLSERLSTTVEPIDPTRAAALVDRTGANPGLLDTITPLVGLILRSREAA